jgi:hypothetical protein
MNIFDGLTKVFAGVITSVAETPCRFLLYSEAQEFDPSSATTIGAAEADSGPLACTPPDGYNNNEIDGTRIKQGDFKVIIGYDQWEGLDPAFGTKPSVDMTFKLETPQHAHAGDFREYTIINVQPFETGANVAAWEVQCRG